MTPDVAALYERLAVTSTVTELRRASTSSSLVPLTTRCVSIKMVDHPTPDDMEQQHEQVGDLVPQLLRICGDVCVDLHTTRTRLLDAAAYTTAASTTLSSSTTATTTTTTHSTAPTENTSHRSVGVSCAAATATATTIATLTVVTVVAANQCVVL